MLQRRYALSPRSRLEAADGAYCLRCDHPLQTVSLNESAWRLLSELRPDTPLDEVAAGADAGTVAFLDGLVLSGALTAEYRLLPARELPPFDVVIPAYADADGVRRCLQALARQRYPLERVRVTVVDDGSPEPLQERAGPAPAGLAVRWLRLDANRGPASARNAGALTPWPERGDPASWLAFVDSDCVPQPDWLEGLAALLEDPFVDAAGGAVRGLSRDGLLARYEDACSSLYLGERPGPVGLPQGALSYLPSCNLAVTRCVYESSRGFRDGWRWGEDVDLSWRMQAAGHGLFYHPAPAVAHDHRTRWIPFMQRRRAYGRSEAVLRRAHPGRIGALLLPGPALALAGAALALWPGWWLGGGLLALVALAGMAALPTWRALRGRHHARPPGAGTLAIAGLRRTVARLLQQSRALNRQTLVFWIPLLVAVPAWWLLGAVVLAAGAWAEWRARKPALSRFTYLCGYSAECLAYSLGRAEGAVVLLLRGDRVKCPEVV